MNIYIILLALLVGVESLLFIQKYKREWKRFKALHKKEYHSKGEEVFRFKIYMTNKLKIMTHNMRHRRSGSSFTVKMNSFGDLLVHEYRRMAAGKKVRRTRRRGGYYVPSGKPLPRQVDLRTQGLVNVPKHQGYSCGSCWTFSTTGAIEGQYAKKYGKLIDLSKQNMLDCATKNYGCDGGYEFFAFDYALTQGINLAKDYPYTEVQGACRSNSSEFNVAIRGYEAIAPGDENALMDAIYNVGPITVGIDSSSQLFAFYSSGIFAPPASQCRADAVDHSFLAVGYGTENNDDYWLIKNSWGTEWGEKGFIKVLRDGSNFCGIVQDPFYPIL